MSSAFNRYTLLIALLMAIFELFISQRTSADISIGSFTLGNSPVVQIVLPTAIAYEIYQSYNLTGRWLDLQRAYVALTKICAPAQYKNDLDGLIRPVLPLLWGVGADSTAGIMRRVDSFADELKGRLFLFAGIILPIAFECLAYYQLFNRFGFGNLFLWTNLALTAVLLVLTGIYLNVRPSEKNGE